MEKKQLPPTAITALVLGILAINFSLLVIPGFIMGAIGKSKAKQGEEDIETHPDLYSGQGMLKAARITSTWGIVLSFLGILYWVFYAFYLYFLFSNLY